MVVPVAATIDVAEYTLIEHSYHRKRRDGAERGGAGLCATCAVRRNAERVPARPKNGSAFVYAPADVLKYI